MVNVMQKNPTTGDDISLLGVLRRGTLIYYMGSVVFGAGIALLTVGSAFVVLFQIHYGSEPEKILLSVIFIGVGIALLLTGINMMIRQAKYGRYVVGISTFASLLAVLVFTITYSDSWYYPLVSYVLILYIIGFLVLLGNVFTTVIISKIESKSESTVRRDKEIKTYTDEDIDQDIEEATRKSITSAASELKFKIGDTKRVRRGKAFYETRGIIRRIKDDIDEVKSLRKTKNPGGKEKWGSIGIDKASTQLGETLRKKSVKKWRFAVIVEEIEKKFKKFIRSVEHKAKQMIYYYRAK